MAPAEDHSSGEGENRGIKHKQRLVGAAVKGKGMKNLLTMTAMIEVGTGLVLVALPSQLVLNCVSYR